MVQNGMGLKKFTKLVGQGLHGNHPAYDTYVVKQMEMFKRQYSNFSPEQANEFIMNVLIPDLKIKISLASNSGLNLNEYFKRFI